MDRRRFLQSGVALAAAPGLGAVRTRFLLLLLPALAAPAVAAPTAPPAPQAGAPRRPNILFVFSDDHAAQAVSAYGSNRVRTPNIDRLAREGMLFENCFCGNSICAPSRATVLTGLHSHANGVLDNVSVFDGSQTTFPKLLRAAGYETAMIGKWHLKSDPTGFDYWRVLPGQGSYYNPELKSPDGVEEHHGYTTEIVTDLALDWLREGRDAERPFLLMLQHKAPHRSWEPGPRELGMFDHTIFPEPATLFDDWQGRATAAREQEMTVAEHLILGYDLKMDYPPRRADEAQRAAWEAVYGPKLAEYRAQALEGDDLVRWKYQRYMQDYLACIVGVDRQVGRVLDYLDESGLAQDTVVVYSSDQGFYLGEHGWFDKRWMYEESLRMPLLVRWPGVVAPGSRCARMVQNIDFAPTLLDVAGVAAPASMHGVSAAPLLCGEDPPDWRRSIYYHYYEFPGAHSVARHYGVRTERHKLIHYYRRGEVELFDLERDPDELTSVHDDPAYAAVRGELERELARLQQRYGEPEPEATLERLRQGAARERARAVEARTVLEAAALDADPDELPDPSAKPLTVALLVEVAGDGVLAAQGGGSYGWALAVLDGRPTFCVRNRGQLFSVSAEPLAAPAYLAATLDAEGALALWVDGARAATAPGQLIESRPSDGLTLGRDGGSAVGPWNSEFPFSGEARALTLAWGAADAATLAAWSAQTKR